MCGVTLYILQVRADFEQIIDRKNPKDLFKRNWMKWQSCIITYALESKPTTALKSALDDSDPGTSKDV